ncbi:YlcG family protein [Salmonella enterica]|nr:YlcG family protein [Salmonella enterica]
MTEETISALRTHWQRLRLYRFSGSVLTDYRIIRNAVRLLQKAGESA